MHTNIYTIVYTKIGNLNLFNIVLCNGTLYGVHKTYVSIYGEK